MIYIVSCLGWFNRLTVWHLSVIYCGFACITFRYSTQDWVPGTRFNSSLPPLNPQHLRPPPPRLPQLSHHYQPVIIQSCQHPSNIFELLHHLQRPPVGLKGHRHAPLRLFLQSLLHTPILSPGAHFRGLVPVIERPPCNEHITLGTFQEVVNPLLQDHYRVSHISVHEVYPKCAAARRPRWESSHKVICVVCCPQEGYTVNPGIV